MSDPSDSDETGFMESLGGIRKLKHDRVNLLEQKPRAPSRRIKKPSSELEHQHSIHSHHIPETTSESWFHHGLQQKLKRKIKMGQLPIDAVLDLHGYRQVDAIPELEHFLQQAIRSHARCLLIIHGKGFRSRSQAVLRPLVQHWLHQQPLVLAYCPAHVRDGGSGASYVYLKKV